MNIVKYIRIQTKFDIMSFFILNLYSRLVMKVKKAGQLPLDEEWRR